MKNYLWFHLIIAIGYWFYLIYQYPGFYSKAYLLGRALTWPFQLLMWFFN